MKNIYLIKYNNNIIGVYDNLTDAKLYIESCIQNNFINDKISIVTFTLNSCFKHKEELVFNNDNNNCFCPCLKRNEIKPEIRQQPIINKEDINVQPIIKKEDINSEFNKLLQRQREIIKIDQEFKNPLVKEPELKKNDIPEVKTETKAYLDLAKQKIDIQHDLNLLNKKKEKLEELKQVYETDINLYKRFKEMSEKNPKFIIPTLFTEKYKLFQKLDAEDNISFETFTQEFNTKKEDVKELFSDSDYNNKFYNRKREEIDEEVEYESDTSGTETSSSSDEENQ